MVLKRRRALNPKKEWGAGEEKRLLQYLRNENFDAKRLLKLFPGRTLPSIRSKVRKFRIGYDLFGNSYRSTKENFTSDIARLARPKRVFDAYAGAGHQTFIWAQVANVVYSSEKLIQKYKQFKKNALKEGYVQIGIVDNWIEFAKGEKRIFLYCGDAVAAATYLSANKIIIDLIDLDTCGSSLPTIPIFLTLLKPKHLVITHGEFHSMRFMREDVLRRTLPHRDIDKSPFPLTVDHMAQELDKAVKVYALRSHNETNNSYWANLEKEKWLGDKFHGMLRRYYSISKPAATADCLNYLAKH